MSPSRFASTREGPDRLAWKIRAFFLGGFLGIAGIYLEISWLLTGALIVLLGGMLLRFLPAPDMDLEEHDPEPEGGKPLP